MRPMCFFIRFAFVSLLLLLFLYPMAQPGNTAKLKVDIKRQLFHDYIDKEQKNALKADGTADNVFKTSGDEEINFLITQNLTKGVDVLQYKIETDSVLQHGTKVNYLRGIENMLKSYTAKVKTRRFNASYWPQIIETYERAMEKDIKGESIEPLIVKGNYEVGNIVLISTAFDKNVGRPSAKNALLLKYAHLHPEQVFSMLTDNYNVPFRDSLIVVTGYKYPNLLYDFAAANNKLGYAIRNINDTLVRAISKMATSGGNGQIYFPFLDNIVKGKMTLADIDAVRNDSIQYYKLLVKTHLDYRERLLNKDTAFEYESLNEMLEKKSATGFCECDQWFA